MHETSWITGEFELEAGELEFKRGIVWNTSGCCASGTCDINLIDVDAALEALIPASSAAVERLIAAGALS